jgi:DNA-binding HxlR family transcriptional regulator
MIKPKREKYFSISHNYVNVNLISNNVLICHKTSKITTSHITVVNHQIKRRKRVLKMRSQYTCPLELTHDIIKGKWKPMILWQLGKGKRSLADLMREIQGAGQKMLMEHLKELQEFGMVDKYQFEGYPLKVEYFLTENGKKLLEVVENMQIIGIALMKENGQEELLKEKGFLTSN